MAMTKETFLGRLERLERELVAQRPELELTVRDQTLGVEGFVVVWNSGPGKAGPLGPCGKGGTRITPTVSLAEVTMLAQRMALKNAAAGLPMGGAKSGLRGDPDAPGFETIYRRFVQLVRPILCENGGIFGGFGFDIGARPEHAVWACDELGSGRSFTGKPLRLGGTDYDREGIAGLGVAIAGKTIMELSGRSFHGASIAVQGLGAMGAAVLRYSTEMGAVVRAISDPRIGGTYLFGHGLPDHIRGTIVTQDLGKARVLLETSEAVRRASSDDVLYEDVDVLFPCAVQDVVTVENASRIRARCFVEGANNPTSRDAQRLLYSQGTIVVPDFVANPGGIIAAYVEMTSDVTPEENLRTRANPERAAALTRERIARNIAEIFALASSLAIDPVDAARYLTLEKVCHR